MPAGAGGFHQTTREYRNTIEMVERLRMVLVEEHTLRMKCMMTMRGRIFTTFQMAHMFVQVGRALSRLFVHPQGCSAVAPTWVLLA